MNDNKLMSITENEKQLTPRHLDTQTPKHPNTQTPPKHPQHTQ